MEMLTRSDARSHLLDLTWATDLLSLSAGAAEMVQVGLMREHIHKQRGRRCVDLILQFVR